MKVLESCFELLEKFENRSYRGKDKVVVTFDDVKKFVDLFIALNNEEKNIVYECITEKIGRILISFTSEMSARAIDTEKAEWIERAIVLHIVEGFRFDYRENYRVLIFLYFAVQNLNIDLSEIIRKLCIFASPGAKDRLEYFFNRNSELNNLISYGFTVKKVQGVTKFIAV